MSDEDAADGAEAAEVTNQDGEPLNPGEVAAHYVGVIRETFSDKMSDQVLHAMTVNGAESVKVVLEQGPEFAVSYLTLQDELALALKPLIAASPSLRTSRRKVCDELGGILRRINELRWDVDDESHFYGIPGYVMCMASRQLLKASAKLMPREFTIEVLMSIIVAGVTIASLFFGDYSDWKLAFTAVFVATIAILRSLYKERKAGHQRMVKLVAEIHRALGRRQAARLIELEVLPVADEPSRVHDE